MLMKWLAVLKPRAARLACCIMPFIASTKALLRLSNMPRTTASKCVLSVVAKRLNESSRLRRAHDNQAFTHQSEI